MNGMYDDFLRCRLNSTFTSISGKPMEKGYKESVRRVFLFSMPHAVDFAVNIHGFCGSRTIFDPCVKNIVSCNLRLRSND